MSISTWTPEFEQELTAFLKDWLKQQGRTQADLRRSLRAISTRMPALLEVLEQDHKRQGLSGLAARLCRVEQQWQEEDHPVSSQEAAPVQDPFSQLDQLLQEIRDDCPT